MPPPFKVIWRRYLIVNALAGFIVRAMERGESVNDITAAVTEIDRRLARDPNHEGESRPNFERVLIESPLSVTFEVHEDERVVYVLRVRYSARRSQRG